MHFAIPVLILATLAACQSRPSAPTETGSTAPDTLAYELRTYEARSQRCVKPDSLCAVASFKYPLFTGNAFRALSDSLRTDVTSMADAEGDPELRARSLEEAAKNFTTDYDNFLKSQGDSLSFAQAWKLEVTTDVLRQSPKWVSVALHWFNDSGGAHPNHSTRYVNYNRVTGHRLQIDELFQADYQKTLTGIAERHFRQNEGLKSGESLVNRYFFDKGVFTLNDNFTLTPTSLKFLYVPYEIKSYAEGETILEIPLRELQGILKPTVL
ncbi:MAG: DUF3298 domain-containing protein [Sphingobacteriaceae bacterium]|nr:DUF3298 domain-containing protein [Cytophagaceae bacterium]